jgi:hypothetical protein
MKIAEIIICALIISYFIWLFYSLKKIKYEIWIKLVDEDWMVICTKKTLKEAREKKRELEEKNKFWLEQIQITKIY